MQKNSSKSLYIHLPFCSKKCLFCSFAIAVSQTHRIDEYLTYLDGELQKNRGAHLQTIYLGGGTPSFLSVPQLECVSASIKKYFEIAPDAEWTIESNPDDIDAQKAAAIKQLGFTRVSLGVQSFNDAFLKFLGRSHDAAQARRAFEILRECGFKNINMDLMYGFPKQTRQELQQDLEAVARLQSEHVSIYTLTIEPNSRFYATHMKLDSDDKLADDYVCVGRSLEEAGLRQYEVSNFARPGFESRHNKVYWLGGDYIGAGMGAHSLSGNARFWNVSTLKEYMEQMRAQGQAVESREELSAQTRFMELVIFGLRMNEGIDLPILEKETGFALPRDRRQMIEDFIKEGLLECHNNRIRTTLQGRLVLDELSSRLI